jgi:ATP-dependent 26S proteasome regulatory subunit
LKKQDISLNDVLVSRGLAAFPLILIPEEDEIQIKRAAIDAAERLEWELRAWTCTNGMQNYLGDEQWDVVSGDTQKPRLALQHILEEVVEEIEAYRDSQSSREAVSRMYLLHDFRPWIVDVLVNRMIRDLVPLLKEIGSMIVFTGPGIKIPPELEREVLTTHLPMPDAKSAVGIMKLAVGEKRFKKLSADDKHQLVDAASGLNYHEMECAFALAASQKDLTPKGIWTNKAKVVDSPELQFIENTGSLDDIGGMELAKQWLIDRAMAYSRDAQTYELPSPLGCVLLGPPGTGKTVLTKAIGTVFNAPVLRMNMGACMRPHIGESERIFRDVRARCDSMKRVVLQIDEFEKMFKGASSSGQSDGGLFIRMFGEFLTWMSERSANDSRVFIAATCNAIKDLDAALTRAGRFDVIFYVDLPTTVERRAIAKIHVAKHKMVEVNSDGLSEIASHSKNYSGSEIEQAIKNAMFAAFKDGMRPTVVTDIIPCLKKLRPSAELYKEELKEMKRWKDRTEPASIEEHVQATGARNTRVAAEAQGLN